MPLAAIRRRTWAFLDGLIQYVNILSTPTPGSPARIMTARASSWTRSAIPVRLKCARFWSS
jgi:hypothetical protein